MNLNLNKNDLRLLGGILLLIAVSFGVYFFVTSQKGNFVTIEVNHKLIKTLSLSKNTKYTIEGYHGGKNILVIKNGYANIVDADCPDKLCVKQKKISKRGETLICLPHRVVVTVVSNSKNNHLDAISN